MRIALFPSDEMGCGSYRLLFVAEPLIAQGADVVIDRKGPDLHWFQFRAPNGRDGPVELVETDDEGKPGGYFEDQPGPYHRIGGMGPYDANVVVMQRPARRWWSDMIPLLHEQGIRVVVDVDDAFYAVHKDHVSYSAYHHGDEAAVVHHRWVDKACEQADLVTCTTPALLRRYGYGHGVVLPNLVPESYLSIFGLKEPNTVGWSGFVGTHPGDLNVTDGAIPAALSEVGGDWHFHVVGDPRGVHEGLGLDLRTPISATGAVKFADYAARLAELEIGIVPLADSAFNVSKSCLKSMELASLGVPVVMSATPNNVRLHKMGIGFLVEPTGRGGKDASGRGQWRRHVTKLMRNVNMRYDVGEQGRELMSSLTYEKKCWMWLEAWEGKLTEAVI